MVTRVSLRYAKINAVEGKSVLVTGVNPQTGKHVNLEIENVSEPTLSKLKYCLIARNFLKIFGGSGKGEPEFRFSEEDPPEKRDDSYFTLFSYASKAGYNPLFLKKLDRHLVPMERKAITNVGKYLLNLIDKLG